MSAPLSPKRLAEIAARVAAASPAPWETDLMTGPGGGIGVATEGDFDVWVIPIQDLDPADAAFIAAARQDVPALLAEVERLQKEAARLQRVADQEHKAFIDTHSALNLLRDDANRVMAENGVQAQQAELGRAREQATKFKVQRGEWAAKARTAVARVAELEQQLASANESASVAAEALRLKGQHIAEQHDDLVHALGRDGSGLDWPDLVDLATGYMRTAEGLEKAKDERIAALEKQVASVRAFAVSHEYRWLHELLDGYGTHGGAL